MNASDIPTTPPMSDEEFNNWMIVVDTLELIVRQFKGSHCPRGDEELTRRFLSSLSPQTRRDAVRLGFFQNMDNIRKGDAFRRGRNRRRRREREKGAR